MIYLFYSDEIVATGEVPSPYCCAKDTPDARMFRYFRLAEYVIRVEGNKVEELKNRFDTTLKFEIDDEDILALKLRSVLLFP